MNEVLTFTFLPVVFGTKVTPIERLLFSLPVQFDELDVYRSHATAECCFAALKDATRVIVEALHGLQPFEVDHHETTVLQANKVFRNQYDLRDNGLFQEVITKFDDIHHRCVESAKLNHPSGWLTMLPIGQNHFNLTVQKFRDALALCYKKPLLNLPPCCDGCGAPSSLDHALCCRKVA